MKDIPQFRTTRCDRPSNIDLIEALQAAKRKLRNTPVNNGTIGICWCLPSNCAGDYLGEYIMVSLGSASWLTAWIGNNRPDYSRSYRAMRKARLMWIDWMIASLENKEYKP